VGETLFPFVSKVKNMDMVDGPDADKSEWINLKFLMDPDNPASKYSRQFAIFKDEFPEEWIMLIKCLHVDGLSVRLRT
jgi:hypothetical protein